MVAKSWLEGKRNIPVGAPVESADGHRLGVVTQADVHELLVEDGVGSHHTYALNLIDVAQVESGTLRLKLTADEAAEQRAVA